MYFATNKLEGAFVTSFHVDSQLAAEVIAISVSKFAYDVAYKGCLRAIADTYKLTSAVGRISQQIVQLGRNSRTHMDARYLSTAEANFRLKAELTGDLKEIALLSYGTAKQRLDSAISRLPINAPATALRSAVDRHRNAIASLKSKVTLPQLEAPAVALSLADTISAIDSTDLTTMNLAEIDSLFDVVDMDPTFDADPSFNAQDIKALAIDPRFSVSCPTPLRIHVSYNSRRKGTFVVDSLYSAGDLQKDAEQIQTAIRRYCSSNNLKPAAELVSKEKF